MEEARTPPPPFPAQPSAPAGEPPPAGGFQQRTGRTLAELAVVIVPLVALALCWRGCQGAATDAVVARIPLSTDQAVGRAIAEVQRRALTVQGDVPAPAAARIARAFADTAGALRPVERAALPGLRVTAVHDGTPNAFALPGGEVFVLDGLVTRVKGDDLALRGVLAHELGHAVRRHGMRRIVGDQLGTLALGVILGDIAGVSSQVVTLAAGLEGLRYSRRMEEEADDFGAALLARRGESAEGLARFLESLGDQPVPTLLSTHPDPAERARRIRRRAGR